MNPAAEARRLVADAGGRRVLVGIAGAPGAGKSTFAAALVAELGSTAALVPMDGFHLANSALAALGRADRKGAPDTFDAAGYAALLRRLREEPTETVWAPCFHRDVEESFAAEIAVGPAIEVVVTEGNYLLLPDHPWSAVRPLLDVCWYVERPEAHRLADLIARHIAHGRSADAARAWVERSDEPNARRIETTRNRCDRVILLTDPPEPLKGEGDSPDEVSGVRS